MEIKSLCIGCKLLSKSNENADWKDVPKDNSQLTNTEKSKNISSILLIGFCWVRSQIIWKMFNYHVNIVVLLGTFHHSDKKSLFGFDNGINCSDQFSLEFYRICYVWWQITSKVCRLIHFRNSFEFKNASPCETKWIIDTWSNHFSQRKPTQNRLKNHSIFYFFALHWKRALKLKK